MTLCGRSRKMGRRFERRCTLSLCPQHVNGSPKVPAIWYPVLVIEEPKAELMIPSSERITSPELPGWHTDFKHVRSTAVIPVGMRTMASRKKHQNGHGAQSETNATTENALAVLADVIEATAARRLRGTPLTHGCRCSPAIHVQERKEDRRVGFRRPAGDGRAGTIDQILARVQNAPTGGLDARYELHEEILIRKLALEFAGKLARFLRNSDRVEFAYA